MSEEAIALTASIVPAYVGSHQIAPGDIPGLVMLSIFV